MEESKELNLTIEIDLKNKNFYIGDESGAGAEYSYENIDNLAEKIKFYLVNYYKDKINSKENN